MEDVPLINSDSIGNCMIEQYMMLKLWFRKSGFNIVGNIGELPINFPIFPEGDCIMFKYFANNIQFTAAIAYSHYCHPESMKCQYVLQYYFYIIQCNTETWYNKVLLPATVNKLEFKPTSIAQFKKTIIGLKESIAENNIERLKMLSDRIRTEYMLDRMRNI